jgi:hypothetical protein
MAVPASVVIETCACGEEVVVARRKGQRAKVHLDALPILPEGPCGTCRGTGQASFRTPRSHGSFHGFGAGDLAGKMTSDTGTCLACDGTGRRGEALTQDHFVLANDGQARRFDGVRGTWESCYQPHRCASEAAPGPPRHPDRATAMVEVAASMRRDGAEWREIAEHLDTAPGLIARAVAENHPELRDPAWPDIPLVHDFLGTLDRVAARAA